MSNFKHTYAGAVRQILPGLRSQAQCVFPDHCGQRWHDRWQHWCPLHRSAPWTSHHGRLGVELWNEKKRKSEFVLVSLPGPLDLNYHIRMLHITIALLFYHLISCCCNCFQWCVFISVILPVTLVPMMRGRGISSGRSLQFDTSDSFLCCSRRIFCLFCLSAVRSSAKNADEHLDGTTKHSASFESLFEETAL